MIGRSSGKIDLPSMPATLARIIQLTNSTDATAEQLAQVVKLDQSLSTKVLRLANSAYMGRRSKVETITDAVMTLGFGSVRNLAASASVVDALFPRKMFPGFSWQDMWIHSVNTAVAAEVVYPMITGRGGNNESAFVAGLLHDIGKLIIARTLPPKFQQIVQACTEYNFSMLQAESNFLGTNHAQIGRDLAVQWEFHENLVAGIAYHHSPRNAAGHEDIAMSVHIGNLIAKYMSKSYIQVSEEQKVTTQTILDAGDLEAKDLELALDHARERMRQCGELLAWGNEMPGAKKAA